MSDRFLKESDLALKSTLVIDPDGGVQPGLALKHGSIIDFYDVDNNTFTRFSQQVGEFWFINKGSTNISVIRDGQMFFRDSNGIESPYTTSKEVATYALMVADGTPNHLIIYKVSTDEDKSMSNTIYQWWPDGKRVWLVAQDDN